jgi:Cu2+-containing amine oxidase
VHDDGVRWMSAETSGRNQISDRVRRGEKLLLWATYYGANYRYMIEYGFTDDGMITCRIGPTGRNIFGRQKDQSDTHLHIGCWRMEMDLGDPVKKTGGPKANEVLLARRVFDEEHEKFAQVARPFNKNGLGQACEGSARWVPEEFTTLRVQSTVRKNSHGRAVSYDLISQRLGSVRQLQNEGWDSETTNMDFINHDFWVTRTESGNTDYIDVPRYAKDKRTLSGQPTTIWLCTPAIHVARSEDFGQDTGTNNYLGVAITTWAGFMLKPRDLFDGTPLYTPPARRSPYGGD